MAFVHKLVNNLNLFDVATEVFSDYMGARSTDNFFGSDFNKISIDKITLGTTIIQVLNQVLYVYALNQFKERLSKVSHYSGDQIP